MTVVRTSPLKGQRYNPVIRTTHPYVKDKYRAARSRHLIAIMDVYPEGEWVRYDEMEFIKKKRGTSNE